LLLSPYSRRFNEIYGIRFFIILFQILFLFTLNSCTWHWHPNSKSYETQYAHLEDNIRFKKGMEESKYFLVILVNARHLDYTNNKSFFRTLAKHPSDGSKNSDVGHAWIYLRGHIDGQLIEIEGGHSGETGFLQPKYFEGVMNNIDRGVCNPIQYLWAVQRDGFFQVGSGKHRPTFAAKVNLTEEQFWNLLCFITNYPYSNYSLVGNQCSTFVAMAAAIASLEVDCKININIDNKIYFNREAFTLWEDPIYSTLPISTPDIIECSLMKAVQEGKAEPALEWYLKKHPISFKERFDKSLENMLNFPKRLQRVLYFW
jgi:hypothetical protein